MQQWSDENPHPIIESHQQQTSVNVWGGIVGDHLLGPFFYQEDLLMQDFLIVLRQCLWYLHDGAPALFSHQIRRHLNIVFRGRWIGRGNDAPINWPSRSPDAADYYLWDILNLSFIAVLLIQKKKFVSE
ncbi:hypothetical protein NQ318_011903 [Aromia moschata]|uniref:Uncharacterized protein n=1 Tax=Aromia moschata TaxID=1265417 RepID=A0AAV8YAN0_9CUCU|nr:hypothetical protein NQ318_011903 [Aromia moschata]